MEVSLEMGLSQPYQSTQVTRTNKTHVDDADAQFVSKVLATTEDHWHKVFQAEGRTQQEPKLVFYTGRTKTGCGVGQASAGPFYRPTDKKIYLDMSFYKELTTKYKAMGTLPWPTSSPTKSATTYKTSWESLANTIGCNKVFLKRNEMPSASALRVASRLSSRRLGPLHSRPKSSRYRRYRRSHECSPCRRRRYSPGASLRLLGAR